MRSLTLSQESQTNQIAHGSINIFDPLYKITLYAIILSAVKICKPATVHCPKITEVKLPETRVQTSDARQHSH